MINTIIIDDTKEHRQTLRNLLLEYNDIELIGQFGNAEDGLKGIRELSPDLIFLDVEMPPGLNGIEMLAQIPKNERTFGVIFTTAYDRFAIDAIELSCLAYLDKPIEQDKLAAAMEKHRIESDRSTRLAKYEVLVEHLKDLPSGQKPIALPLSNKAGEKDHRFVRMDDIAYFASPGADGSNDNAGGRYTTFFFANGESIGVSNLLRYWENKLSAYGAVRISKGVVINMKYVHTYRRSDSAVTLFFNDRESRPLTVGDRYHSGFEAHFLK